MESKRSGGGDGGGHREKEMHAISFVCSYIHYKKVYCIVANWLQKYKERLNVNLMIVSFYPRRIYMYK